MATPAPEPKTQAYSAVARKVTTALCYLFAVGVALQVFTIGMVFLGGQVRYLEVHRTVGMWLGVVAILTIVGSLVARTSWRVALSAFVLLTLYVLQYTLIDARNGPFVRAFHAVNALLLFWLALDLGRQLTSFRTVSRPGA